MTKIFQVDSFTDSLFKGNPAGVSLVDGSQPDSWMQSVAQEMNLSETAFISPMEGIEGSFSLRWFTPLAEVDLCGHGTLASAHILWEEEGEAEDELIFHTLSGELRVWREADLIWMDLPTDTLEAVDIPDGLLEPLGLSALGAGQVKLFKGRLDYLLHIDCDEGEEIVNSITPDFDALSMIPSRGFIVTAASGGEGFDFVSRFFAPALGIDEDPVTGSAHCALGPYWARLFGKTDLRAFQASTRSGVVLMSVEETRAPGARINIGGKARTFFKGSL